MADTVNGSLASSRKAVLGVNALHTVSRVDVLDKSDLPASSTTLAGGDGRGSQEVLPDLLYQLANCAEKKHQYMKLTLNHLLPYLASTFSRLAIQLRYQRHNVAE